MAKMTIEQAYKHYFYKNGQHLSGPDFVTAYKDFILDSYNGNFTILNADNTKLLPNKERNVQNLLDFQKIVDDRIYNYVKNLEGKEKEDAYASEVLACTTVDHKKISCAKLNFEEIMNNTKESRTPYQQLTVEMAFAFNHNKPDRSSDGLKNWAKDLRPIAKRIESHKPWLITKLFRPSTYTQKMDEYTILKHTLKGCIHGFAFPKDIKEQFSSKEFNFLHLDEKKVDGSNRHFKNGLINEAENLIPNVETTSIYRKDEVENFKNLYQPIPNQINQVENIDVVEVLNEENIQTGPFVEEQLVNENKIDDPQINP